MSSTNALAPSAAPAVKPYGIAPWIALAFWALWLMAMVAMSVPEWGKSKRILIEQRERTSRE